MSESPITIEIGELELVGFPIARRHAIATAVEAHLGALVRERGLPELRPGRERERVAPALRCDPAAAPDRVGAAIAEAVYRSLGRSQP